MAQSWVHPKLAPSHLFGPILGAPNFEPLFGRSPKSIELPPSSRLDWIWDMIRPPPFLLEEPLATIYSSRPNSNFGYALLLADLNNDAVDDLIIGAPDYFRDEVSASKVKGCVFVVFGSGSDAFKSGNVEDVNDHKICDDTYAYSKFGHAVEVLDSDGDGVQGGNSIGTIWT